VRSRPSCTTAKPNGSISKTKKELEMIQILRRKDEHSPFRSSKKGFEDGNVPGKEGRCVINAVDEWKKGGRASRSSKGELLIYSLDCTRETRKWNKNVGERVSREEKGITPAGQGDSRSMSGGRRKAGSVNVRQRSRGNPKKSLLSKKSFGVNVTVKINGVCRRTRARLGKNGDSFGAGKNKRFMVSEG